MTVNNCVNSIHVGVLKNCCLQKNVGQTDEQTDGQSENYRAPAIFDAGALIKTCNETHRKHNLLFRDAMNLTYSLREAFNL